MMKSTGRLGILILLYFVFIGIFTGCDAGYPVYIENHLDQEITVVVYLHKIELRPCSVKGYGPLSFAPLGKTIPVKAVAKDGTVVYEKGVRLAKLGGYSHGVSVRINPEGPEACPAAVEEPYEVLIQNYTPDTLKICFRGELLGTVVSQEEQVFGPLPGSTSIWDADSIRATFVSEHPPIGVLQRSFTIGYDLGSTPRARVWFDLDQSLGPARETVRCDSSPP